MDKSTVRTPLNPAFRGFTEFVQAKLGRKVQSYHELWAWSTEDTSSFWESLVSFFELEQLSGHRAISDIAFPGNWYSGTQINFAELILEQGNDNDVLIVSLDEDGKEREWHRVEIKYHVKTAQEALISENLQRGDRVAGYVANVPEAVIMLLACASLGLVWTAIGNEYQPDGAVQRLKGSSPSLLVASPSYMHKGSSFARVSQAEQIAVGLGIADRTVFVGPERPGAVSDSALCRWLSFNRPTRRLTACALKYVNTAFGDPLWIVYSSGTTGAPKAIVHGHGGVVLEGFKMHGLQSGLRAGKRLFWHASPSWVMWNVLIASLLCGSSIVCYDGHPGYPHGSRLVTIARDLRVTSLGVSPGYLDGLRKDGGTAKLNNGVVEVVLCTGAPLSRGLHEWALLHFGGLPVCPLSGGTELFGAIVGPVPGELVRPGEMQGRQLAFAAEVWDEDGRSVAEGEGGELVLTQPVPSMPLFLWGDVDGHLFHDAYMSEFPGVWRHGDWAVLEKTGGVSIKGRSDTTLNRNGIRFGSGEVYRCLEDVSEIASSLVVGLELQNGDYWLPLFIEMTQGSSLNNELRQKVIEAIKCKASPRHVPDAIIEVESVPYTRTGKVAELPVKKALLGGDPRSSGNLSSLANPDALMGVVAAGLDHLSGT